MVTKHDEDRASHVAQAAQALRAKFGPELAKLHGALRGLADGQWHQPTEIIHQSGVSYRSLKAMLEALGSAVVDSRDEAVRLRPEVADHLLLALNCSRSESPAPRGTVELASRAEQVARASGQLLSDIGSLISRAPPPLPEFDHVTATPVTVLKRAEFLRTAFDLHNASVLFLGDHDLASLALARLAPTARIAVADRDQRLLNFIADSTGHDEPGIGCLFGDFRVGLPKGLMADADVVFTDPPYSPEGVRIFLARAIQALKQPDTTRILLCYGFSDRTPELGYNVQEVVSQLRLVIEAIIPGFNHYESAPALGDRSDLYILRATRRSLPAADAVKPTYRIYTKGLAAREASDALLSAEVIEAANGILADAERPVARIGFGWAQPSGGKQSTASLGHFMHALQTPKRAPFSKPPYAEGAAISLVPDFADYLPRILLHARSRRLMFVLGRRELAHYAAALRDGGLGRLINPRYRLVQHVAPLNGPVAIAVFQRTEAASDDAVGRALAYVLDRPGARLVNAWREALIETAKAPLTKNEARDLIDATSFARRHRQSHLLDLSDADLSLFADVVTETVGRTNPVLAAESMDMP